jgi:SAM-dependent methyltransferase
MQPGQSESRRLSFNRDAAGYAAARPPYPARVYEILTNECGLRPGCRVLEVGPGSGQATCELLARGASVVAIEPGDNFADLLARSYGGPSLRIIRSDVEHADLGPGPYDLIVAANSFHWIDAPRALARLAEVLRPGGWLAVWWTVFGDPDGRSAFRDAVGPLYLRYMPREWRPPQEVPAPLNTAIRVAELRRGDLFGPVEVEVIRWTHRLTTEAATRLWGTFPNVNELAPDARAAFLGDLAQIVERLGGAVDDRFVTVVYRAQPAPR